MNAFDYQTQTWKDGRAALKLQIEQAEKTLEVLRSPKAQQFVDMTYGTITGRLADGLKTLEDLRELQAQYNMADA